MDALKHKIVLLESDLNKVESARDKVVVQIKNIETNTEEAMGEIMNLGNMIATLEGKLSNWCIHTCHLSNTCTCYHGS